MFSFSLFITPLYLVPTLPQAFTTLDPVWITPRNVITFSLANLWLWMKYSRCCDFPIQQPKPIWCCHGNAYRLFPVTHPRHHLHYQGTYSPVSSCLNIPDSKREEIHFPQLTER